MVGTTGDRSLRMGSSSMANLSISSQVTTKSAVWNEPANRRMPAFQQAVQNLLKETREPDAEATIRHLAKSSPIYGGVLRREFMNLCLIGQKPCSAVLNWPILRVAKLAEHIPGKIGRHRSKLFLSVNGFALLDHMAQKYPRFTPYWDLFQSDKVRKQAAIFLSIRNLGGVPQVVRDIQDHNETEQAKIAAKELANKLEKKSLAMQQQAYEQALLPQNTYGWSAGTANQGVLGGFLGPFT